jgi:hypothetical protein
MIYNKLWDSRDNLPDDWKKSHHRAHTETRQTREPYQFLQAYSTNLHTSQNPRYDDLGPTQLVPQKPKLTHRGTSRFLTKQNNNAPANKIYTGIKKAFNQQQSVLVVFVDFSGAYDSIWRAKLIEKLKNMKMVLNNFRSQVD